MNRTEPLRVAAAMAALSELAADAETRRAPDLLDTAEPLRASDFLRAAASAAEHGYGRLAREVAGIADTLLTAGPARW